MAVILTARAIQSGHFDRAGHPEAQRRPDHASEDDPLKAQNLPVKEGDDDRDEHADRGDEVPLPRGGRRGEALQADDEQGGGNEIGERDETGHYRSASRFRLNICSIRSVTT